VAHTPEPSPPEETRKRRTPPKLRPGGTSSSISLDYNKPIKLSDDPSTRPLVGTDVMMWREANSLDRLQVVQMLAMPTPHSFNRVTSGEGRNEPLSFDLEMLLRLYMRRGVHVTQRRPADVFNKIYGPLLERFQGTPSYEAARVMLYSRFGALLGRTVFSAYRWFKTSSSGDYGGASGSLRRLLSQLSDDPVQMREELESLARQTFRVRGYELEELFPLPSVNNPPKMGRGVETMRKAREARAEKKAINRGGGGDDRASSKKKDPAKKAAEQPAAPEDSGARKARTKK
jgi:hypothetical protein